MVPVSYTHNLQAHAKRSATGNRLGVASLRLVGIVLLAVLALLYIAQSSQGATKRVEQQNLRSTASELEEDSRQLLLEIERQKALETISQSAPNLGLESVDSVEFLKK